ncbi:MULTISPECIES: transcriptional regulator SplA domain-containing protein [unclassified Virgibacillus]|uniref:transcriptional regulator SplA domain-containing protein n=1 Tax=unclassified Virgibacillus TaxID=2620237 RepID=UPI0024DE12AC|nr:transcriptional regulator SplA domain-containing protein [Virgibacillus sp. LDC-1]
MVNETFSAGEIVYVIIRNPHVQGVANVQQAAIVENPEQRGQLALFVYETYYPLSDEFAIFKSEEEAENAYQEAFSGAVMDDGDLYG